MAFLSFASVFLKETENIFSAFLSRGIFFLYLEVEFRGQLEKLRKPKHQLQSILSPEALDCRIIFAIVFVSFPQERNGIVSSSAMNYLHSGGNIQTE